MEIYIGFGGYKIICDGCSKKVKVSHIKKIEGKFYCPDCQKEIVENKNK